MYYDNGRLRRIVVRWSGIKPKNISITYVGGYASSNIPDAIKKHLLVLPLRMFMTSLQTSSKADTGTVGSHLADNTASSNI